ncbi:MAG: hypothetical protein D3910_05190 [Candidatus Electrothrix sp. ATG2]|nr:hypothetical protein [Candidatus Electrothrix sp. ATG2]
MAFDFSCSEGKCHACLLQNGMGGYLGRTAKKNLQQEDPAITCIRLSIIYVCVILTPENISCRT